MRVGACFVDLDMTPSVSRGRTPPRGVSCKRSLRPFDLCDAPRRFSATAAAKAATTMTVREEQQAALARPGVTGGGGGPSDKPRHERTSHLTDSATTTPTTTTTTTASAAVASPFGAPRSTTIAKSKGAVHFAMNYVEPADNHVGRSGTTPVHANGTSSRASSVAAAASTSSRRTSARGGGTATRKAPGLGRRGGEAGAHKQQSVRATEEDSGNREGETFKYQSRLPKLEVPPLEETLNRYLGAVAPLLSPQAFLRTKAIVEEVRGTDGGGGGNVRLLSWYSVHVQGSHSSDRR